MQSMAFFWMDGASWLILFSFLGLGSSLSGHGPGEGGVTSLIMVDWFCLTVPAPVYVKGTGEGCIIEIFGAAFLGA